MQLSHFVKHLLLNSLSFGMAALTSAAVAGDDTLTSLVSKIYERYAWVAVFSADAENTRRPLQQEALSTLREFFATDLADAVEQDWQCVHRTHEICRLDFDILFDSQDPAATDLTIKAKRQGLVEVCFKGFSRETKCLLYIGRQMQGKMRIEDIKYDSERSLRTLLGLSRNTPHPP